MQSLKQGSTGPDVEAWQNFLVGQGSYWLDVDGDFTHDTIEGTKDFQKSQGLDQDGEVGPGTLKAAISVGFPDPDAAAATGEDVLGPSWPPKPDFPSLGFMERAKIFGTFAFAPAPVPGNPEAIKITDGWDKHNIVTVDIPQLHGTKGCPNGKVSFHTKGAKQLQGLWAAWEAAGLLPLVLTFDGAWNPRFVRGSTKYLSNHSYGTAFDVNYSWNKLGCVPALVGKEGSVRKLVPIAHAHGFYAGMHFQRLDGMHFEIAKIIP
jgi:hypothetical protein